MQEEASSSPERTTSPSKLSITRNILILVGLLVVLFYIFSLGLVYFVVSEKFQKIIDNKQRDQSLATNSTPIGFQLNSKTYEFLDNLGRLKPLI